MNPQNKSEAPFILRRLFEKAVLVADPMQTIPSFLPQKPSGKVIVIGAGKASARMAEFADACAITNTSLESITAFEENVLVKLPPLPLRYTVYPLNETGALDGL